MVLIIGFLVYSDSITVIQAIGIVLVAIASITIERRKLTQANNSEVLTVTLKLNLLNISNYD